MRYVITIEDRETFERFSVTRWAESSDEAIEAWESELDSQDWFEGVLRVIKVRAATRGE